MSSCTVCLERFAASGERLPKVLPCGHSICAQCLGQLPQTSQGSVACPSCRLEAPASDVQTNFAVVEVLELLAGQQGAAGGGGGSWQPLHAQAMQQPSRGHTLQAPLLESMPAPSAPPAPWEVGPQSAYESQAFQGPGGGELDHGSAAEPPEELGEPSRDPVAWSERRRRILKEWGRRREAFLHRPPSILMDQMLSGSGFFPPHQLGDRWFTDAERGMIAELSSLLKDTGHGYFLARDMLTPLLFGVDVRIILDNSGSMYQDMLGNMPPARGGIEARSPEDLDLLRTTLESEIPARGRRVLPASGGLSPFHRRWFLARDALRHWMKVFSVLGLDPWTYQLNPSTRCRASQAERVFEQGPHGRTPMADVLQRVLRDFQQEVLVREPDRSMLVLIITDGEANDMNAFNRLLDEVQNGRHGDVQICLLGLSLVKRDVEWFENEECDETRIRTIEPFEVEQRQIQLKEVVTREGGYNFAMHTYRALVTNYFPADYDYEAPLQNLRHRLYITLHGRDRWWGLNNDCYRCLVSNVLCTLCFAATCCHCNGWCQGNECCANKYQVPDCLEPCCDE